MTDALTEAERRGWEAGRREGLAEAAQIISDEADKVDDAIRWGGEKKYVVRCKAASYAMRDRETAIRALIDAPPREVTLADHAIHERVSGALNGMMEAWRTGRNEPMQAAYEAALRAIEKGGEE